MRAYCTYVVGVSNWVAWVDAGVENEPLTAFHRLARYPGTGEKVLDTSSREKEQLCAEMIPEERSRLNAGIDGGEDVLSSAKVASVASTRSLTCCSSDVSGNSSDSIAFFC